MREIEAALNAVIKKDVASPRLRFAGFPAAMGEAAIKVTFEAFGALKSLEVDESVDGLSCTGTAEFEGVDAAKRAVDLRKRRSNDQAPET